MKYFVKTPWWIKRIFPFYTWSIPTKEKVLYLTFDDGPHSEITPFVLKELKRYDALATFFCIGKNVLAWPDIYKQILNEGHAVGNHTQNHLNGWKTSNDVYMKDITEAANYIDSNLFRPPYGKITLFQAKNLSAAMKGRKARVIMWDVLSADFDEGVTAEQSLQYVVFRSSPGSIIVFHDSEKAFQKLSYVLPKALHHFTQQGFKFLSLETN
ncbi:MAG TPA: polysaccharide deacetylase family protein [Chitinophagaceae bacterium]|jgi:peptidoglycan/xylan/chitin deacetylase (PgdA/CDA1 family)|nr:polysaccharide deacetylase family protein [Chitinophagaceae bacterium]